MKDLKIEKLEKNEKLEKLKLEKIEKLKYKLKYIKSKQKGGMLTPTIDTIDTIDEQWQQIQELYNKDKYQENKNGYIYYNLFCEDLETSQYNNINITKHVKAKKIIKVISTLGDIHLDGEKYTARRLLNIITTKPDLKEKIINYYSNQSRFYKETNAQVLLNKIHFNINMDFFDELKYELNIYKFHIFYPNNIHPTVFFNSFKQILNKDLFIFNTLKIKEKFEHDTCMPYLVGYFRIKDHHDYVSKIEKINNLILNENIIWNIQFGDTDIIAVLMILSMLWNYTSNGDDYLIEKNKDNIKKINDIVDTFSKIYGDDITKIESFQNLLLNDTLSQMYNIQKQMYKESADAEGFPY